MTKLDWTKAGLISLDPARVSDVGDYGILPDRLTPSKNKRKKKKIKKVVAYSSEIRASSPKVGASIDNIESAVSQISKIEGSNIPKRPRGGLTIPEMVSRAEGKIEKLISEISKEERKLKKLREQLAQAQYQLQKAKDTPRRSAVGQALHEAQKQKST